MKFKTGNIILDTSDKHDDLAIIFKISKNNIETYWFKSKRIRIINNFSCININYLKRNCIVLK